MKKVVVFSGSNSSKSINLQVASYTACLLQNNAPSIIDLRDFELPIYSIDIEENEGIPQKAQELYTVFQDAAGFIIASPEHNGNVPAFFKNHIDWLSRIQIKFFEKKPIFLLTVSPGKNGGGSVHDNLLKLIPFLGGNIVASMKIGNYTETDAADYFTKHTSLFSELAANIITFEKSFL